MTNNQSNSDLIKDHLVDISTTFTSTNNRRDTKYLIATLGIKSYGTIIFGHNQSNKANFIRIPSNASPSYVKQLIVQRCANKRPSLVISVTGSAREYNMKSKLFRVFRQGLLKVVKTTDVWIITGGVNTSITKLIGEIIRTNPDQSRPVHLIGIAPWGCVSGVEQLDVHGTNVIYAKSRTDENNEIPLEPNHTQFIFIDDGTKYQYGGEIQFRNQFEKSIAGESFVTLNNQHDSSDKTHSEDKSTSSYSQLDSVPVVLLVLDGGLETIQKVHESVIKNKIPVVLLEGTGGCCDLFAKCYHLYNEYRPRSKTLLETNIDPSFLSEKNEQIKNKIRERFKSVYSETLYVNENIDYFQLIYECIDSRMIFLNFIDFKPHSHVERDVDLAILQALLNATNSNEENVEQKLEQLNLALEWNRVDIVKSFIMKTERDWTKINLNGLFFKALMRNQTSFIQLFLDHDFSLNNLFQNPIQLLRLYQNQNYIFKHHFDDPLRAIYKDIIQPLIGDFFEVDAIFSPHAMNSHNTDNQPSQSPPVLFNETTDTHTNQNVQPNATIYLHSDAIDVEKELFLWSVLTGKQELALLFWARGKNKVCAALIATLLYKSKAEKEKDIRYNEWGYQFENLAVQILEKFYRLHPSQCNQAIIREIPQFGNVTWLHLAVMAEAKLFIAQRAVQNVLNSIWYGYIDRQVGHVKIIFSTFMLWYSGFLPYHDDMIEDSQLTLNLKRNYVSEMQYTTNINENFAQCKLIEDELNEEQILNDNYDNSSLKKIKSSESQYWKNISKFVDAPYVKYLYNLYAHILFLILFSYVILFDFFPLYKFESDTCLIGSEDNINADIKKNSSESSKYSLNPRPRPSITEIILIIWMITILFEEIRQIMAMELKTIRGKVTEYLSIFWNKLDLLIVILFFIAIILRYIPSRNCFCSARILLALDLSLWYIRTLDIFSAIKRLGPKLVMIGAMVHDMKFFMLVITVFILAFGVPAYSLMYGVEKFSWSIPRSIINMAYWQIFGELTILDEIEENYDISGYIVFILLILYMTVSSVLLINLLIAMISNTFDRLQTDTDCIWKFQHYSLVCYHLTRPRLPPPFIIFSHIWRIILYFFSHYIKLKWFEKKYIQYKNKGKFRIIIDERMTRNIEAIEDALGNEIYYFFSKIDRKQIDFQTDFDEERMYLLKLIKNIFISFIYSFSRHSPQQIVLNKIKTLENRVRTIQNQQDDMFEYLECLMSGIKKIGGDDIEMPKGTRTNSELICRNIQFRSTLTNELIHKIQNNGIL
ncbi:unnamed protein product [Adineta steineri]|uniref:Uncharacterized protein n=1 Tax=Adineta steineri TaxID=433720 RepID=A0A815TSU2_9BILA|nr:unnamed protein product [Adineta steineri]CAF1510021.1 unnamed protein product [Adineta steineri]